jgi:hypothetical protein
MVWPHADSIETAVCLKEFDTMSGKGNKLAGFEDAMVFDNGEEVAFTVKASTGKQIRVHCPLAELGDIFSYLALKRE